MDVNYNDGKWHGWNGGECPVHPKSEVEVRWDMPLEERRGFDGSADRWLEACWRHGAGHGHIVAFRVVKQYREPRDLWHLLDSHGQVMDTFTDEGKARAATRLLGCTSIVHYREVMEGEA